MELVVHDGELLHLVLAEDLPGLIQRGALRCGDQIVSGHHVVNELAHVGLKFHIPVGNDTDELTAVANRYAGNLILRAQLVRLGQRMAGAQPEGICNDAVLASLHHVHLLGLLTDGHIFMDHTDAALPCQGDGHAGFRNRVHGRAHHRDIQGNLAGQTGVQIHIRREDIALRRDQKHIIKGKSSLDKLFVPRRLHHIPLLHFS